jgi:DNA-binding transcriptional LysR family regulator
LYSFFRLGRTFGVVSTLTWRLADLGAKLEFLRAGFGWGHMPVPVVEDHLARKELVKIRIEGAAEYARLPMHAVYRKDAPPGPAGRAFIQQLKGSYSPSGLFGKMALRVK